MLTPAAALLEVIMASTHHRVLHTPVLLVVFIHLLLVLAFHLCRLRQRTALEDDDIPLAPLAGSDPEVGSPRPTASTGVVVGCESTRDARTLYVVDSCGPGMNLTGTPSAPLLKCACATEEEAWKQNARNISLHVTHSTIYRFPPGSDIPVGIKWSTFKHLTSDQKHLVRCGLESTLATLNALQLGIRFHHVGAAKDDVKDDGQRGLVQLQYGGDKTVYLPDGRAIPTWASTVFPDPTQERYPVYIYAAAFEADYIPAFSNVLCHEIAHLLCMRHCPPHWNEPPSVQYPAGDFDTQSIMGRFDHPGDLFFHPKDVKWLQRLYEKKAGDKIYGNVIADVPVPSYK